MIGKLLKETSPEIRSKVYIATKCASVMTMESLRRLIRTVSRLADTSTGKLVSIHPRSRGSVPEVAQEAGRGEDRSLSGKPGLPQLCASLTYSR
jgi:hypothetical protein